MVYVKFIFLVVGAFLDTCLLFTAGSVLRLISLSVCLGMVLFSRHVRFAVSAFKKVARGQLMHENSAVLAVLVDGSSQEQTVESVSGLLSTCPRCKGAIGYGYMCTGHYESLMWTYSLEYVGIEALMRAEFYRLSYTDICLKLVGLSNHAARLSVHASIRHAMYQYCTTAATDGLYRFTKAVIRN